MSAVIFLTDPIGRRTRANYWASQEGAPSQAVVELPVAQRLINPADVSFLSRVSFFFARAKKRKQRAANAHTAQVRPAQASLSSEGT